MQLMAPAPMNALRQARNASPSSERRTPGTAAINPDLFKRAGAPPDNEGTRGLILPIFVASVYSLQAARRPHLEAGNWNQSPSSGGPGVLGRDGTRTSKRGAPWLRQSIARGIH